MRHALILAGGLGTRLWPMSRERLPKQLLPIIDGKSLLEIAYTRLENLVPCERRFICAAEKHRDLIFDILPDMEQSRYLGEPTGRDTLNALALSSAVIAKNDPDAVIAVFTADHLIEPIDQFIGYVDEAYSIVETTAATLMTFGVTPTYGATGFGYLDLGEDFEGSAKTVMEFREKPDVTTAREYFKAGPSRYLWNSGMFVWKAKVFLDCVARYEPEIYKEIQTITAAWSTPESSSVISSIYPTLKKISVDFAVMEPASKDAEVQVASLALPLTWLDVGSWPAFADTRPQDDAGNVVRDKTVLMDSKNIVSASTDPDHVIAAIGCEDLIIIHTDDATLVCNKNDAEAIKQMRQIIADDHGDRYI